MPHTSHGIGVKFLSPSLSVPICKMERTTIAEPHRVEVIVYKLA